MDKLKSRKLWFAIVGALLPIVTQYMNSEILSERAFELSAGIIIAYILGQGYVDGQEKKNGLPQKEEN